MIIGANDVLPFVTTSLQRKHFGQHKHRSPSGIFIIVGTCSNSLPPKRLQGWVTGMGPTTTETNFHLCEDFAISKRIGSGGNLTVILI